MKPKSQACFKYTIRLTSFVILLTVIGSCQNTQKEEYPVLNSAKIALDSAEFFINSSQDLKGKEWLVKTDSLASLSEDELIKCHVLANYAWIYEKAYLYDSALNYYIKSLSLAEKIGESKVIMNRLRSLGRIYRAQSHFGKSVEAYERLLTVAKKYEDPSNIASASNSLGNILSDLGDSERSMAYYKQALKIWEKEKSKAVSYSIALHNMATTLVDLDSIEEALPILYRALMIKDSLGRESSKAYTFSALGTAYQELDSLDKSRQMFLQAFNIRRRLEDKPGLGQVLLRIGELDIIRREYILASKNLDSAEDISIETTNPELLRDVLAARKDLYKATNQQTNWIATDELYDVLTDSLQRKQRLKVQEAQAQAELQREQQKTAIAEQNARIANIKAESERQKGQLRLYLVLVALLGIVIASWQLWQIRKRNASLITLNERIKLITDNAFHSQKNALGLISALLRSKARQTAHDKELEVLRDVEGKIEALGGVAKYLFQTRLTDNIEVAASIQLATYLETLIQDTFSSVASDMAKLEIKLEEISVTSTEALNIGLIANEAITNFSKYAETFGADELQIKTKRQESELLLQIRDNGPGFPEGFNISKSTGFGMQMMANLVDDMEGALSMFRQEGWTLIQITIPLKA